MLKTHKKVHFKSQFFYIKYQINNSLHLNINNSQSMNLALRNYASEI